MVVLGAMGCKKRPANLEDGEACTSWVDCKSSLCYQGRCTSGQDGAPCTPGIVVTGCQEGFECIVDTCMSPALAAASRKKADAAKERELLERSGVEVPARAEVAEQPAAPVLPGSRIRVVTTTSKGSAFAACRRDERLTGGSCTGWNLDQNGPTGFGPDDTVGARWSCRAVGREVEVTAVALCAGAR